MPAFLMAKRVINCDTDIKGTPVMGRRRPAAEGNVMLMLAASTTESTLVMVRSLVVSFQNAMRKGADPVYERDSHSSFDVHE